MHIAVCAALKSAKIDHYYFRNPPTKSGFGWQEVMPSFDVNNQNCDLEDYRAALSHPRAEEGFQSGFHAMENCDTCVMVLPCGKSAHLELGWFVGMGRRTIIMAEDPIQPELMYKMADIIVPDLFTLLGALGVKD